MTIVLNPVIAPEDTWAEVFASPQYFLYCIDAAAGNFGFLKTTQDILAAEPFNDDRSVLSVDGKLLYAPIEEALKWQKFNFLQNRTNRFVFHSGYCGSTLMSRVLSVEGKVFSYKEPKIITQLAELKANQHDFYTDKEVWSSLISFVTKQYADSWQVAEVNIIKPSHWVNSALPDLATEGGKSKVLLISQEPEQFLTAVFRGGGERLQGISAFLKQMRHAFPDYYRIVSEVESRSLDTTALYSKFALIAHAVQKKAFRQLSALLPMKDQFHCTYNQLIKDPREVVSTASMILGLSLTADDIDVSVFKQFPKDAKNQDQDFDLAQLERVNKEVWQRYQADFDSALEWYESVTELSAN